VGEDHFERGFAAAGKESIRRLACFESGEDGGAFIEGQGREGPAGLARRSLLDGGEGVPICRLELLVLSSELPVDVVDDARLFRAGITVGGDESVYPGSEGGGLIGIQNAKFCESSRIPRAGGGGRRGGGEKNSAFQIRTSRNWLWRSYREESGSGNEDVQEPIASALPAHFRSRLQARCGAANW